MVFESVRNARRSHGSVSVVRKREHCQQNRTKYLAFYVQSRGETFTLTINGNATIVLEISFRFQGGLDRFVGLDASNRSSPRFGSAPFRRLIDDLIEFSRNSVPN